MTVRCYEFDDISDLSIFNFKVPSVFDDADASYEGSKSVKNTLSPSVYPLVDASDFAVQTINPVYQFKC